MPLIQKSSLAGRFLVMKRIGLRLMAIAAVVIVSASLAVPAAADTGDVITMAKTNTNLKFEGSSENDDWEFNRQAEDNQYLLPDADTYFITEQNINWMEDDQLTLARSEFFARRGRKFSTKWIQEYFNKQKWYHGKISEKKFNANLFNAYETANVKFIVAYENKRKTKRKKKLTKIRMTGPNEIDEEYTDIYEGYNEAALTGWDAEHTSALGLQWISADRDAMKSMAYTCMDLDGDGNNEFIVGSSDEKSFGEGAAFAIYTTVKGSPKGLLRSDGNISYFICEDGQIRREETSDDGRWSISFFKLKNGALECTSVLVMDENENPEEPWYFLSTDEKMQSCVASTGDASGSSKDENLSGTDSFNLKKIPVDQVGSIGLEMMQNVTLEEASEIRTVNTSEELQMVSFLVAEDTEEE